MSESEILALMTDGYRLHYAPISGGLCLMKQAQDPVFIAVEPFLKLRADGKIRHCDTQGQGHDVFHGRVDVYEIVR